MYKSKKDLAFYCLLKQRVMPILKKQMNDTVENIGFLRKENVPGKMFLEGILKLERQAVGILTPIFEIEENFSIMLDEMEKMPREILEAIIDETAMHAAEKIAKKIIKQLEEADAVVNT